MICHHFSKSQKLNKFLAKPYLRSKLARLVSLSCAVTTRWNVLWTRSRNTARAGCTVPVDGRPHCRATAQLRPCLRERPSSELVDSPQAWQCKYLYTCVYKTGTSSQTLRPHTQLAAWTRWAFRMTRTSRTLSQPHPQRRKMRTDDALSQQLLHWSWALKWAQVWRMNCHCMWTAAASLIRTHCCYRRRRTRHLLTTSWKAATYRRRTLRNDYQMYHLFNIWKPVIEPMHQNDWYPTWILAALSCHPSWVKTYSLTIIKIYLLQVHA